MLLVSKCIQKMYVERGSEIVFQTDTQTGMTPLYACKRGHKSKKKKKNNQKMNAMAMFNSSEKRLIATNECEKNTCEKNHVESTK